MAKACPACGMPYDGDPICDHPAYEMRRVHVAGFDTLFDTRQHCDEVDCDWGDNHRTVFVPAGS